MKEFSKKKLARFGVIAVVMSILCCAIALGACDSIGTVTNGTYAYSGESVYQHNNIKSLDLTYFGSETAASMTTSFSGVEIYYFTRIDMTSDMADFVYSTGAIGFSYKLNNNNFIVPKDKNTSTADVKENNPAGWSRSFTAKYSKSNNTITITAKYTRTTSLSDGFRYTLVYTLQS